MLRPGTQDSYISRRVNLPTEKSHAEIVSDMEPKIKAQSFFSARVAEAHILDKLREVSDGYSRGEFGLGEARNKLKDFLRGEGYDPHQAGLRNLASTARLNLILKQNAAMAHSAAEWKRMHDPDAMKVFPYVRYHARNDSRTRGEHAHLDGRIFRKDDPFLSTHTPPWEFNCRCWLEEITEKEAGKTPDLIQEPTPQDEVRVESRSGFSFDPAHAFEEFDLGCVKNDAARINVHNGLLALCQKGNCSASFYGAKPQKLLPESYREPENIEEIRETFQKVEKRREIPLDEFSISLGKILPEHIKRLGLKDFREDIIFKHEKANFRVGPNHWEQHHSDTLNEHDAIELFRHTIWNPNAELREDIVGKRRRICFYVKDKDSGELTNVWVTKDNDGRLILEVVDSWKPERQYIDHLGSHHKKKHPDRS